MCQFEDCSLNSVEGLVILKVKFSNGAFVTHLGLTEVEHFPFSSAKLSRNCHAMSFFDPLIELSILMIFIK